MSNLVALLKSIYDHTSNDRRRTSSGMKRFLMEALEPRVLPSGDADALGALINQTDFRPEEAIVLVFHDEDSAIVAASETEVEEGGHELRELHELIGFDFEVFREGAEEEEETGDDFIDHDAYEETYGDFDYDEFLMLEEENGPQGGSGGIVEEDAFPADVLANNNAGATGTSSFTQSETSVLVFGNTVLIAFNDSGSISGGTNKFTGFSRSTDGGVTFNDGGVLPTNPGGDAGDPVLARNDTTGRVYFSTLSMSAEGTIQMFRSDDGGATWLAPVNATPGGNTEDKQWHTVDNFAGPGNGNVYLVSRRFGSTAPGIYFFRSTDNGDTFGPTGGSLIVSGAQPVQGAFVTVGPDHSVYVFWLQGTTIQMRKSTDQGVTFAAPVTVASGLATTVNGDLVLTGLRQGTATASGFRSNGFPHAAVNPINGDIYVTFNNDALGTDRADVFLVQSTDGGVTWGPQIRVNDDVTTTDQWQPTLAVTPDGAKLGIFYSSRQEDPANNLFKYYGRIADISGSTLTFTPSFAISDTASLPEFGRDAPVNPVYMGDYNTAFATTGFFHVVWSDNRDDLAGGAGRKDPNVYYKAIDLGLTVRSTSPLNGAVVTTIPLDYVVNFSDAINVATVEASDFTVDGVIADSFIINSPTQVTFRYLSAPFSVNGLHTMAMAAASVLRSSDGDTLAAFSASFRWDSLLLQVSSTVPPTGGTFFLPTPFTYDVNFNEAISPSSVQTFDLVLGGLVGATVSAVTVLPGNTTARFTLTGIVDQGTLTANIMAGAIADAFGNPGGAFSALYQVDLVTASYPTPLIAKNPLGSLIYDPTQNGVISFAGDIDNFTLDVDANQTFSVIVTTTATTFVPQVEIRDPNNVFRGFATAASAGQPAIIQTNYANIGGVYNFAVSGAGNTLGSYTVQVILNSALEMEGRVSGAANNGIANPVETPVNAVDSGSLQANGSHTSTNNNYIAGFQTLGNVEVRNYTTFALSPWTPTILAAELRLFNTLIGYSSPDPTETYTLFDVSASAAALDTTRLAGDATGISIFNDLGSGTIYGTRAVSASDNNTTVAIQLNAAAVAALNASIGSTISFGGAITTLAGAVTQTMFGGTSGALGQVQLILLTSGPTQSIDSSFLTLSTPQASAERGAVLGQTDAGNYLAASAPFVFEDISTTGTVITPLANQDNTAVSVPIGFAFPFYGVSNTSVIVGSNGILNFVGANLSGTNTDLTTIPTQATIAPFWDDLHTGGGLPNSNVYFQTLGSGTDQHLTVQWNNVRFASGGTAGDTITFEAQLYVDGRIRFNYLDLVSGTAPGNNGASATVGTKAIGTQGPNRTLLAFNNGPNAFVGTGQSTLLTVTSPTSDYYSLALDPGEIVTLAATGQTTGNLTLQLRNSSEAILATGVTSSNLTSVISNFVVPSGGLYYVRVTGDGTTTLPYSLVITKNAAMDTEANSTPATAQTLITEGVLGSISGSTLLNASDSGWILGDGSHTAANNNYLVGQQPLGLFRDYFVFALPAATGTIIGAELRVFNPAGGFVSSDPTETYTLFDVSATPAALDANRLTGDLTGIAIHADLGSGTVYGTRVVSSVDNNATVAITLNADAIAALNAAIGSTISFGGSLTTIVGTATQILFGFSTGAPGTVQLVLQTTPDDWYSITMPATANALRVETSTPGDGPGQFANTLNPIIQLYDSTGTILLASGVAMSDGRNEFILANGLTPGGTYKVRVTGQSGTTGEYFLTRTFSGAVITAELPTIEAIDIATMSVASFDAEGWSSSVDSYTVQVSNRRSFLEEWFAEGLDELTTPIQNGEVMEYFG